MSVITLLTDFGSRDHYVGSLKGVILTIAPDATVVDITHEIEPHDILRAAFVLRQVWPWFPVGTIHVAVVDPGVGTDRRVLLGRYDDRYVIAPDNGLMTLLHRDSQLQAMYVVENRRFFSAELSATFHARDIMAPAAAHLANGVRPQEFGRTTNRIEMLAVPHRAEITHGRIRGRVLYTDRFGTLITNIRQEQLAGRTASDPTWTVTVNDTKIGPIRTTFADTDVGAPVAFVGSCGLLEVAVNRGRAVDRFGPVDAVVIELH